MSSFKQRKLPLQLQYKAPKPVNYPKNSNSFIISTDSDESNAGIFQYDIDNNTVKLLQKYDDTNDKYKFVAHGLFIDYTNHKLCMFGGGDSISNNEECLFLDLKTTKMTSHLNMFDYYVGGYPNCVNMYNDEQIYIFAPEEPMHMIFDTQQQSVLKIDASTDTTYCKLLYIPSTSQLMILGQDGSKDIWKCHVEPNSKQTKYNWQMDSKLKMSYAASDETAHDLL